MSVLHLIRTSAFKDNNLRQCIKTLSTSDVAILLDDGCYNASHQQFNDLKNKLSLSNIFAVEEHSLARNLTLNDINTISINQLIQFINDSTNVITWQ